MKNFEIIKNLSEKNFEAIYASGLLTEMLRADVEEFLTLAKDLDNRYEVAIAKEALENFSEYEAYADALGDNILNNIEEDEEDPFLAELEKRHDDQLQDYARQCRSEFMRKNLSGGDELTICHI